MSSALIYIANTLISAFVDLMQILALMEDIAVTHCWSPTVRKAYLLFMCIRLL